MPTTIGTMDGGDYATAPGAVVLPDLSEEEIDDSTTTATRRIIPMIVNENGNDEDDAAVEAANLMQPPPLESLVVDSANMSTAGSAPSDVDGMDNIDDAKNDSSDSARTPSPKGQRRRHRMEFPVSFWYQMCQRFMNNQSLYHHSQIKFLRSPDSGVLDESFKVSFGKRLKAFKAGTLPQNDSVKRMRKGKYQDVEKCLIAYIETRETCCGRGKTNITWPYLTELAKRFATALGYDPNDFQASPGWISNVLKRNNISISVDLCDDDVLYYLEAVKKHCKKSNLGKDVEVLSERLYRLVKKKVKKNDGEQEILGPAQQPQHPRPHTISGIIGPELPPPHPPSTMDMYLGSGDGEEGPVDSVLDSSDGRLPLAAGIATLPFWPLPNQNG